MEEPSNKELMHFISDIKDDVADIKERGLPEINNRVKVTNGSVADIKAWKERMTGAMWAFGITFTVIIIPLFVWAFNTISNIGDNIDASVKNSLSAYNIIHE